MVVRDKEFTEVEIESSLSENLIDRNSTLNNFISALNSITSNTFLAIDAQWGSGKTVFVKQLEHLNLASDEKKYPNINSTTLAKFKDSYIVFYYNAWENDHHSDPLQSLLFTLIDKFYSDKSMQTKVNNLKRAAVRSIVNNSIKSATGGIVDLADIEDKNIDSMDELVKEIKTATDRKNAVSDVIRAIVPKGKKLLFIIDELDRCNPTYAVNILETVKHYYIDSNCVFLVSTNNRQLIHTIKKHYGEGFDAYGYLDKFYDLILELPTIDVSSYMVAKLGATRNSSLDGVPREVAEHLKMSMREIDRYHSTIQIVKPILDAKSGLARHDIYSALTQYVFIPLALGLRIKDIRRYDSFLKADVDGEQILLDFVNSSELVKGGVMRTFSRAGDKLDVPPEEKALRTYLAVMKNDTDTHQEERRGIREARKTFSEVLPLMSMAIRLDDAPDILNDEKG